MCLRLIILSQMQAGEFTWSFITTMFRLKRSWCVIIPVNHWVAESCLYTRTRYPFKEYGPGRKILTFIQSTAASFYCLTLKHIQAHFCVFVLSIVFFYFFYACLSTYIQVCALLSTLNKWNVLFGQWLIANEVN